MNSVILEKVDKSKYILVSFQNLDLFCQRKKNQLNMFDYSPPTQLNPLITHFHRFTPLSVSPLLHPSTASAPILLPISTPMAARRLLAALLAASLLLPLARPDSTSTLPATTTTAYDELRLRGFPRGLLPANVQGYTLDAGSGDFAVDLLSSCRIVLPAGSYLASFNNRLTGRLGDGRISGLDGIRVRAFFRWWSITGIRADGDQLVFEVGSVSAKFPARDFNASLECPANAAS